MFYVKEPRTVAEVVGVARDAKYASLDEPPQPFVYRPLAQDWAGFMTLIVHTAGCPEQFTAPLRATLTALDPNLRVYEIETLEECAAGSLFQVRWQAALLAVFGGLAMVLAAVGLYGMVAYTVAQQTRELGIRMAMRWVPLRKPYLKQSPCFMVLAKCPIHGALVNLQQS
jgi:putative ABC transport system permease protein